MDDDNERKRREDVAKRVLKLHNTIHFVLIEIELWMEG
jgi:hypothetical protein